MRGGLSGAYWVVRTKSTRALPEVGRGPGKFGPRGYACRLGRPNKFGLYDAHVCRDTRMCSEFSPPLCFVVCIWKYEYQTYILACH